MPLCPRPCHSARQALGSKERGHGNVDAGAHQAKQARVAERGLHRRGAARQGPCRGVIEHVAGNVCSSADARGCAAPPPNVCWVQGYDRRDGKSGASIPAPRPPWTRTTAHLRRPRPHPIVDALLGVARRVALEVAHAPHQVCRTKRRRGQRVLGRAGRGAGAGEGAGRHSLAPCAGVQAGAPAGSRRARAARQIRCEACTRARAHAPARRTLVPAAASSA